MPSKRPPKFVIGPGFIAALMFAGVILWQRRSEPPPVTERPTVATAEPLEVERSEIGLTPEPGWLLRRADEVGLEADQRESLAQLVAEWERDTAEDRAAVETAGAEVAAYVDQRRVQGGLDQEAARARASALSEVSARLAEQRHVYWERAWDVLSEPQRDKVRALRRESPLELR